MAVEIVVSLITLAGSALGTLAGIMINSKLSNYRIEQLEKKVDKHNNLIERTYKIEQHNAVIDEKLRSPITGLTTLRNFINKKGEL